MRIWLRAAAVAIAAIAGTSAGSAGARTDPLCGTAAAKPVWFQPIAAYYHCNPGITPRFDFASLYGGATAKRETGHQPRRER